MIFRWLATVLTTPVLVLPALSQGLPESPPIPARLVNIETAKVSNPGALDAKVDVRLFSGDEDITYTSLELRYGLGRRFEGIIRGTAAEKKNFSLAGGAGTIRHGGNDFEIGGKYQIGDSRRLAVLLGVSFPGTPAQSQAVITLGGAFTYPAGRNLLLSLNPRAAFIDHNTLVGIGFGSSVALGPHANFIADWTAIATGDNTRNTSTGGLKPRSVYGVALRFSSYAQHDAYTLDIGYSSGVGSTTGFSLTPGLSGSGAFYIALAVHH